jgi:hypothetical protein
MRKTNQVLGIPTTFYDSILAHFGTHSDEWSYLH